MSRFKSYTKRVHHDLHILWGVSLDTGCQPPRVSNKLLLISFLASDNWAHPWLKLTKINESLSHYMQKGFASKTTEEAVTTVTISVKRQNPPLTWLATPHYFIYWGYFHIGSIHLVNLLIRYMYLCIRQIIRYTDTYK